MSETSVDDVVARLKTTAAELTAAGAQATEQALVAAVQAELLEAMPGLRASAEGAETAATAADEAAEAEQVKLAALEARLTDARRRLGGCSEAEDNDDLTTEITALSLKYACEEAVRRAQARVAAQGGPCAEARAQATAARVAAGEAAAALAAADAAIGDPLHHPRARESVAYMAAWTAGRWWRPYLMSLGGITPEPGTAESAEYVMAVATFDLITELTGRADRLRAEGRNAEPGKLLAVLADPALSHSAATMRGAVDAPPRRHGDIAADPQTMLDRPSQPPADGWMNALMHPGGR